MDNKLALQEKVELFVKENKILKRDFAKSIGITPVKLSHWLKGHILLNRQILERIVVMLDGNE